MKILYYLIISILILSCSTQSSDESKLFEIAKEEIKKNLVAPSSVKFPKFDKNLVKITDSLGVGNPMLEAMDLTKYSEEDANNLRVKASKYDNTPYSYASVDLEFESQNRFGVLVKDRKIVYFQKWKHKDGKDSEWKMDYID